MYPVVSHSYWVPLAVCFMIVVLDLLHFSVVAKCLRLSLLGFWICFMSPVVSHSCRVCLAVTYRILELPHVFRSLP